MKKYWNRVEHIITDRELGEIRSERIRTDQNESGQIRTDQNRSEEILTDQNGSEKIRTDQN